MSTHNGTNAVYATLREYLDSVDFSNDRVREISSAIAANLGVEYQQFPKWD
jgi:hypothetical protein